MRLIETRFKGRISVAAALFVSLSSCGGGGGGASTNPQPTPDPLPPLADPIIQGDIDIRLTLIAEGFSVPIWGTHAPNDLTRLFVVDQIGVISVVDLSSGQGTPFLDVSDRVVYTPEEVIADERGLLGLAFHPGYASNGLLYTFTSEPGAGNSDFPLSGGGSPDHQSVVAEWRVNMPADPSAVVDTSSRREVLRIDQPDTNHNAGGLVFDNDGFLLIALGDGGGLFDPGGNSQNTANPLGAILRIDLAGNDSANGNYGIPTVNPFFGLTGFVDEILAFGFRNPYRMSVDSVTGELWIGDVGERSIEEINIVVAGSNYGWRRKEGPYCLNGQTLERDPTLCNSTGLSDPVAGYSHDEGVAIIGGFVYRGSQLSDLTGRYVFGDFIGTGPFEAGSGRLFYLDDSRILEFGFSDRAELGDNLIGFGEDAAGELYVMVYSLGSSADTGRVYRIDPS